MPQIDFTPEEVAALVAAADMALDDQEHYLDYGDPEKDYGSDWPEAAALKAQLFQTLASALRKFNVVQMVEDCETLAKRFTHECAPCHDKGWLLVENSDHGTRIEKCDACGFFNTDKEAEAAALADGIAPIIHCEHCGSTGEHVQMMAMVAGISDPICCEH